MAHYASSTIFTRIDPQGRLVIPAEMRRSIGLECGEEVALAIEDGVLQVITLDKAIERAQAIAERHVKGKKGVVDDFILNRRRDSGD